MKTAQTTEYITAEKNLQSSTIRNLSPLDKACSSMVIRGTWIFDTPVDINAMKSWLKKLLKYYPHLVWRMKDQTWFCFTNDGIPFTITEEPNLSIYAIQNTPISIQHFSTKIHPSKIQRGIEAPLSIKITTVKDGYVLGIQCSHACMDGQSFYTMVENRWKICRNEEFALPVLDQSLLPIPENISKEKIIESALDHGRKKLSLWSLFKLIWTTLLGRSKGRSSAFSISTHTIENLKQKISQEKWFSCSANIALSAYISKMCIKLFGHTKPTTCTQVTVINIRNRVADIPSTFVGNASTTIVSQPFSAEATMGDIAQTIQQTLAPLLKAPSQELKTIFVVNTTVLKQNLPLVPFDVIGMNIRKPTVFYINNFSKLPIYEVDFGFGKPISVLPHDLSDQVVIWPAPPAKWGVEIYFSGVPAHKIRTLKEKDPWLQEMDEQSKQ